MNTGRNSPRPLQNRVDPFGELHAVSARGALMGNRGGRLHGPDKTLGRARWMSKRWIICLCVFRGRQREVWGAGYTELFFLDEPTALAAGHRPCFECRRQTAMAFLEAFPGNAANADAMDATLHRERLAGGRKRLWRARLEALPDGTFVSIDAAAHAIRGRRLLPWSFEGYGASIAFDQRAEADVLTPRSSVAALAAGYRPLWAPSTDVPA